VFDGTDMAGVSPSHFAAKGIGRTFQNLALFKHGTVVENILTGRHTHLRSNVLDAVIFFGRTRREEIEARRRVEHIIEFLEIEHIRDAVVGTLSYGQRKLLELAYVLVSDPAVILLDEPAGGVNLSLVNHIADRIRELNAAGTTFLIVEHNMEFVMGLCDRVTVLDSGTVVASGPPGIIRTDRRVLNAYLGEDLEPAEDE
jgi:branched-chain amino acid transport system ATP-binding protein